MAAKKRTPSTPRPVLMYDTAVPPAFLCFASLIGLPLDLLNLDRPLANLGLPEALVSGLESLLRFPPSVSIRER